MNMRMHRDNGTGAARTRGFTLIELMVTVVIVAILSSIAYPSYKDYVERARRAEAKSRLLDAAAWMERNYALRNEYPVLTQDALNNAGFGQSPSTGRVYYWLSLEKTTATSFKLAAWINTGVWSVKRCEYLAIDNLGLRTGSYPDCWDR